MFTAANHQAAISLRLEPQKRNEEMTDWKTVNLQPSPVNVTGVKEKHHDLWTAPKGTTETVNFTAVAAESGANALNFDHVSQLS